MKRRRAICERWMVQAFRMMTGRRLRMTRSDVDVSLSQFGAVGQQRPDPDIHILYMSSGGSLSGNHPYAHAARECVGPRSRSAGQHSSTGADQIAPTE